MSSSSNQRSGVTVSAVLPNAPAVAVTAAPRANPPKRTPSDVELNKAAVNIQKNYRGYRERRQLQGLGLSSSQRWSDVVKEAQFRAVVKPKARTDVKAETVEHTHGEPAATVEETALPRGSSTLSRPTTASGKHSRTPSQTRWQKVGMITRRLGGEDADKDISSPSEDENEVGLSEQQRAARKKAKEEKQAKRKERAENARAMGLLYWLEAIDVKHRYGSNLQSYHLYWQNQSTKENFFQWLDHGEGRQLDLSDCPRERLEKERVRYLTREERMAYLVKVDKDGRLCWAKNGEKIDTTEKYRDSVQGAVCHYIFPIHQYSSKLTSGVPGIVPQNDPALAYSPPTGEAVHHERRNSASSDSSSSEYDSDGEERADRYVSKDFEGAKGPKKVFHVSPAVILNHLLRKTTKKNTWIFVADISFRLYVGIKQSGTFQHSSFLNGQRVSAAGLIKVKNGKLRSLSPLSGHYRPPAETFRKFLVSLKEEGVDMSGLHVSKSYGIMLGLEAYSNFFKHGHRKNKPNDATHPEESTKGKPLPEGQHAQTGLNTVCANTLHSSSAEPGQEHAHEEVPAVAEDSLGERIKKRLHIHAHSSSKSDL